MEDEATQPATQPLPGHEGIAPSSINNNYLYGVICLLHPSSPAAYAAVESLSKAKPTHVFKTPDKNASEPDSDPEDLATQQATPGQQFYTDDGLDIALRREPGPKDPELGFLFGRNPNKCDVVIGEKSRTRRISNQHFRIYQNPKGVLMLQDFSTNGTWVDSVKLGGAAAQADHTNGSTHALFAGSIITVAPGDELLRFVVRIPNQSGSGLCPSRAVPVGLSDHPRGAGIDPGPQPRMPPQIRPRPPPKTLAAIRRTPGRLQAIQMHTSLNVQKDLGWNGGGIYKIEGIIGSGAFATVKRGILKKTGDVFAIKIIQKRSVASHSTSVKKEVEILEKLNHPHIVSCKEYHEDDQNLYIVMEYVGGGDLNEYLKHNKYMREDMVQEVSRQVLRGIEYVHGMGISHRDLKPDNILMVTEEPLVVKISDFGLAKMVQSEETFLKTFCGTMLYLAPEVYPGYAINIVAGANSVKRKRNPREDAGREDGRNDKQKKRYNQAVDMWSFGCVIHMLLTGKAPFEGKNADDMLRIILKGYVNTGPLEKILGRDCPEAKDFINRLLQVDPALRMHEQEALQHNWLKSGSDISSSSMEQDEGDEDEDEEAQNDLLMSGEFVGEGEYREEGVSEEWQKRQLPTSHRLTYKPNQEHPKAKPEDTLLGAVSQMSFDQSENKVSIGKDGESANDIFRSLDAESHASSSSRMFRRPPAQGSSGVFPESDYSMSSDTSVPPKKEPFSFDSRAEFQFASQPVVKSNPRGPRTLGRSISEGTLTATEVMVGKLKVASSSPGDTPSPQGSENNKQNRVKAEMSSFDDPAVVYSTPLSLMAPQKSIYLTPLEQARRSSYPENHTPLSQPCNVSQHAEVSNFARPSTPWGRLVPVSGSMSGNSISLNKQMVTIGRSLTCTHILQDIRISKAHFAVQLADPSLSNQPVDDSIWHPQPNMVAWFKVAGTNGCFLNGRKKRKGTIGRIFNGDVVQLFKAEIDGKSEYIGYKCEFRIGVHLRQQMEVSDEDMTAKQKADITAHGASMGISMASTMAVATFAKGREASDEL